MNKAIEKGLIGRLKNVLENEFKWLPYTEIIELLNQTVSKDKIFFVEKKN